MPRPDRRRTVAARPGLGAAEVAAVLERFAASRLRGRGDSNGVAGFDGVRVDATGGLGAETIALLSAVADAGLEPLLAFPVAGAGDAGYTREGELILDRRLAGLLGTLRDDLGARFAFLADPAAIISRCQCEPQPVWERARQELAAAGVSIDGLATSFHDDPAAVYERLWVYMLRQGTPDRFDVGFAPAFSCREWNFPAPLAHFYRGGLDQIERIGYLGERKLETPVFARSFQCELETVPRTRIEISGEAIVYTDGGGWRVLRRGRQGEGSKRLATADVLELVDEAAGRGGSIRLAIDPFDLEPSAAARPRPARPRAASPRVRALPYPYHFFIGLSSDVDWSTPTQVELQAEELCDRLGLEMAGSAFPFSPADSWVAWAGRGARPRRPEGLAGARLARWASEGLLDTLHGLASTFDRVAFHPVGDAVEPSERVPLVVEYRPDRPVRAADHDGILVTMPGAAAGPEQPPELVGETPTGEKVPFAAPEAQRSGELTHFHYDLGDAEGQTLERLELRSARYAGEAVITTTFATARSLEELLECLRAANVRAPVLTSHGGGAGARRLAACVTEEHGKRNPESVTLSMDTPGTPYHLLPALARFGVFFFNPIGWFGTKEPGDIGDLLRVDSNRDGSRSYIFRRFCSRRHERDDAAATWSHGKLSSSAQGLATNLEDLLQRFHWLETGQGCILYTHLGHGVGNRINDRLGWTEELHAAWQRVAEFVHGRDRDRPVPFRLWHAPTSRILAFSLVMKELERHLRVEGNEIHISSWRDEVLGLDIPDPAGFGESWLHGLTVYADEAREATVFVDGRRLEHLTVNPADESGRESISLVDAGNLLPLLHGPGSVLSALPAGARVTTVPERPPRLELESSDELEVEISPVSLRNVTHWTFRASWGQTGDAWPPGMVLRIGVRLSDGSLFTAGTSDEDDWLLVPGPGGSWRTHTFALGASRRSRASVPKGRVVALSIAQSAFPGLRLEQIGLVRPLPVGARAGERRIVAGAVRTAAGTPVRRDVRLASGDLELETTSGEDGFYLFSDLPDRRLFQLEVENAVHFRRGSSIYTSSDFWDWDLVVDES